MEVKQNLQEKAIRGILWSAIQTYSERIVSLVVILVLARLLSPATFGLVAIASIFISFAQIFVDQGFGEAIVYSKKIDHEMLDSAFWANFLISIILMFLCIGTSDFISTFYKEAQLSLIIKVLSIGFVFNAFSTVQQALLRRDLSFRSLAMRSLIATLGSAIIAIGFAVVDFGVWSLVAKSLSYGLIGVIVLWNISPWRPRYAFYWKHFKALFSYGISIVGANIVDFISRRSDDILIGIFLGASLLGYYNIAYSLLLTMTEILIVVPNSVIFPVFARIQDDLRAVREHFYEASQLISLITIPAFIGLALLAEEVTLSLYGSQWITSIQVVRVLMLIGIIHSAFYFYGNLFKALGKPGWRFGMMSLTSILNVIGFVIAVRWGIVAVAASYVIVGYLIAPVYYSLLSRLIHLNTVTYLKLYRPAVTSTVVMGLAILGGRGLMGESIPIYLRLAILTGWGAAVYALVLFVLFRATFFKILKFLLKMMPFLQPLFRPIMLFEGGVQRDVK